MRNSIRLGIGYIVYRIESYEEEEISVGSAIPTIKGTGRKGNNASNNLLARIRAPRECVPLKRVL